MVRQHHRAELEIMEREIETDQRRMEDGEPEAGVEVEQHNVSTVGGAQGSGFPGPVDHRTNDLAPDVSMPEATLESGTVANVKQQCNDDGEANKFTSSSASILPAPSSSSSTDANSVGVVAPSDVEMPDSSVTPPCGNDFCAAPEVKQPPEPLLGDSPGGDVTVTLEVQVASQGPVVQRQVTIPDYTTKSKTTRFRDLLVAASIELSSKEKVVPPVLVALRRRTAQPAKTSSANERDAGTPSAEPDPQCKEAWPGVEPRLAKSDVAGRLSPEDNLENGEVIQAAIEYPFPKLPFYQRLSELETEAELAAVDHENWHSLSLQGIRLARYGSKLAALWIEMLGHDWKVLDNAHRKEWRDMHAAALFSTAHLAAHPFATTFMYDVDLPLVSLRAGDKADDPNRDFTFCLNDRSKDNDMCVGLKIKSLSGSFSTERPQQSTEYDGYAEKFWNDEFLGLSDEFRPIADDPWEQRNAAVAQAWLRQFCVSCVLTCKQLEGPLKTQRDDYPGRESGFEYNPFIFATLFYVRKCLQSYQDLSADECWQMIEAVANCPFLPCHDTSFEIPGPDGPQDFRISDRVPEPLLLIAVDLLRKLVGKDVTTVPNFQVKTLQKLNAHIEFARSQHVRVLCETYRAPLRKVNPARFDPFAVEYHLQSPPQWREERSPTHSTPILPKAFYNMYKPRYEGQGMPFFYQDCGPAYDFSSAVSAVHDFLLSATETTSRLKSTSPRTRLDAGAPHDVVCKVKTADSSRTKPLPQTSVDSAITVQLTNAGGDSFSVTISDYDTKPAEERFHELKLEAARWMSSSTENIIPSVLINFLRQGLRSGSSTEELSTSQSPVAVLQDDELQDGEELVVYVVGPDRFSGFEAFAQADPDERVGWFYHNKNIDAANFFLQIRDHVGIADRGIDEEQVDYGKRVRTYWAESLFCSLAYPYENLSVDGMGASPSSFRPQHHIGGNASAERNFAVVQAWLHEFCYSCLLDIATLPVVLQDDFAAKKSAERDAAASQGEFCFVTLLVVLRPIVEHIALHEYLPVSGPLAFAGNEEITLALQPVWTSAAIWKMIAALANCPPRPALSTQAGDAPLWHLKERVPEPVLLIANDLLMVVMGRQQGRVTEEQEQIIRKLHAAAEFAHAQHVRILEMHLNIRRNGWGVNPDANDETIQQRVQELICATRGMPFQDMNGNCGHQNAYTSQLLVASTQEKKCSPHDCLHHLPVCIFFFSSKKYTLWNSTSMYGSSEQCALLLRCIGFHCVRDTSVSLPNYVICIQQAVVSDSCRGIVFFFRSISVQGQKVDPDAEVFDFQYSTVFYEEDQFHVTQVFRWHAEIMSSLKRDWKGAHERLWKAVFCKDVPEEVSPSVPFAAFFLNSSDEYFVAELIQYHSVSVRK
ncbi:unnamed protein product [Amoebophrya sp. A120]|nr:unnamed protein product [Amoebophrya sp. A120]|eukprot:GSA120T00022940001.1